MEIFRLAYNKIEYISLVRFLKPMGFGAVKIARNEENWENVWACGSRPLGFGRLETLEKCQVSTEYQQKANLISSKLETNGQKPYKIPTKKTSFWHFGKIARSKTRQSELNSTSENFSKVMRLAAEQLYIKKALKNLSCS